MDPLSSREVAFTCFTDLPTELRLKIWKLALPSRLLGIRSVRRHRRPHTSNLEGSYSGIGYPVHTRYRSNQASPPLLFVSRESRAAVLNSYVLIQDDYGPLFYFNARLDTFDVSRLRYEQWLPVAERIAQAHPEHRIRSLAIHLRDLKCRTNLAMGGDVFLLEELFIVRKPTSCLVGGGLRACQVLPIGDTSSLGCWVEELLLSDELGLFCMLEVNQASLFPSKKVPTVKVVLEDFWACSSFSWPIQTPS